LQTEHTLPEHAQQPSGHETLRAFKTRRSPAVTLTAPVEPVVFALSAIAIAITALSTAVATRAPIALIITSVFVESLAA
jgi:hypothetical protein